jgi:putative oxidoreductase
MKYLPIAAGTILGLLFLMASVPVLLNMKMEGGPMSADAIAFMTVFASTGYLKFIKIFELLGGLLVAVPKTRNVGLLILGPIIVNIIAFNALVNKAGVLHPMAIVIYVLSLYLLWVERKAWLGLINR